MWRKETLKNHWSRTSKREEILGILRDRKKNQILSEEHKGKISLSVKKKFKENPEIIKNMSIRMKNNPLAPWKGKKNPEHSKFMSIKMKGSNHWNWLGGKSFEPYDITFNKEFKNLVRLRDNFCCLNCKISEQKHKILCGQILNIHHIDYNKKNTCLQNCCSLCRKCNILANINREYWTTFYQDILAIKYGYVYPLTKVN